MPKLQRFYWPYHDLARLTGLPINSVYAYVTGRRKVATGLNLDPSSLESVLVFLARHARPDLRIRLLREILEPTRGYDIVLLPPEKSQPAKAPRQRRRRQSE